jgi:DNA modification methylase
MVDRLGDLELGRTHCVDCVEGMRRLPDASIDCVLADPPFNLGQRRMFRHGRLARATDMQWDTIDNGPWLAEALRVLRPTGSLFVFGTLHSIFEVGYLLQRAGVRVINTIVLAKANGFSVSHRLLYERTTYVIWATKAQHGWTFDHRLLRHLMQRAPDNVWHYAPPARRCHPTQKPLDVIERMVLMATRPGDLVLDPFMGSGTTAEVCVRQERGFLGFEKLPRYAEVANARIERLAWAEDFARARGDAA